MTPIEQRVRHALENSGSLNLSPWAGLMSAATSLPGPPTKRSAPNPPVSRSASRPPEPVPSQPWPSAADEEEVSRVRARPHVTDIAFATSFASRELHKTHRMTRDGSSPSDSGVSAHLPEKAHGGHR